MQLTKQEAQNVARTIGARVAALLGETLPDTAATNYVSPTAIGILATKYSTTADLVEAGVQMILSAAQAEGSLFASYSEAKQIRYGVDRVLGWSETDTSNADGSPTDAAARAAAIKDAQGRIDEANMYLAHKDLAPALRDAWEAKLKIAQDDLLIATGTVPTAAAAPYPDTRTKAEVAADTKADNKREAQITAAEKKS
jgi:hypothetical protein